MQVESYSEFVGLTSQAISLIEAFRSSPQESKSAILVRVLQPLAVLPESKELEDFIDYGEGIRIRIGEPLFLFLSDKNRNPRLADATAKITRKGFFLDGKKVGPSEKRQFTPAMKIVQKQKNHRNAEGELVSLSAIKRWHVLREGKITSVRDLKIPSLARTRNTSKLHLDDINLDLSDLGL